MYNYCMSNFLLYETYEDFKSGLHINSNPSIGLTLCMKRFKQLICPGISVSFFQMKTSFNSTLNEDGLEVAIVRQEVADKKMISTLEALIPKNGEDDNQKEHIAIVLLRDSLKTINPIKVNLVESQEVVNFFNPIAQGFVDELLSKEQLSKNELYFILDHSLMSEDTTLITKLLKQPSCSQALSLLEKIIEEKFLYFCLNNVNFLIDLYDLKILSKDSLNKLCKQFSTSLDMYKEQMSCILALDLHINHLEKQESQNPLHSVRKI